MLTSNVLLPTAASINVVVLTLAVFWIFLMCADRSLTLSLFSMPLRWLCNRLARVHWGNSYLILKPLVLASTIKLYDNSHLSQNCYFLLPPGLSYFPDDFFHPFYPSHPLHLFDCSHIVLSHSCNQEVQYHSFNAPRRLKS